MQKTYIISTFLYESEGWTKKENLYELYEII